MHDFADAIPNPASESYRFHPLAENSTGRPVDNGDKSRDSPAFLALAGDFPVDESPDGN
jgi:hypothetical protein